MPDESRSLRTLTLKMVIFPRANRLTAARIRGSRLPDYIGVVLLAMAFCASTFCGEIHIAAKNGDLSKIKELLATNPDLVFSRDSDDEPPLFPAVKGGHVNVAAFLLANKAQVNAKTPDHVSGGG